MAGNIKGIILEIGGDTSGLQKSLSKVNSASASLSKELRGINTLLKLDPKNTELLSQKQEVLNKQIKTTENKLEELQRVKAEADKKMAEGTQINEENYRALQREIINTQNKLNKLKSEASNWTKAGEALDNVGNKINGIGEKVGNLGNTLTKRVTTSVIGLEGLAVKAFNDVDDGADIAIKKTGATADMAVELEETYKKVAGNVVGSFEEIGNAVGEINTRFGFTNKELEEASQKFLKFAKVNDTDVNTAVQKVSRYMGDANIESSKYGEVLDILTSAAQTSGISIDTLTESLTKYGAPMRALGLTTQESIAILASWEKAGVNTEIAFSGMKKAISNWGKAGKDSSKEFKKALNEIEKAPTIAKATTKAIEIFGAKAGPDLADAIKGGRFEYSKFLETLEKSNGIVQETYTNITDETDEAQLAMKKIKIEFSEVGKEILTNAYPAIEDVLGIIKDLINKFNKLDPEMKKNILKYTALAGAMGPVLKIGGNLTTTTGKSIKWIGSLCTELGKAKNGMETANNATGKLATGLTKLATPGGIAAVAITTAVAIIVAEIAKAEAETKKKFETMGNSANEFYQGIQNATGYLDDFNATLFASTEEQENLQKQMDEIQEGITNICKTASDERRGYTQEEITQLDEYFKKLRELKDREIEIQNQIAGAITQQAVTNAETFQGTLDEYKVQSEEWIATAQQQADKTIEIINQASIEEVALLNQRYGDQANMQNEAYATEYNNLMEQKQQKIDTANEEVAKINEIYTQGYIDRANQDGQFGEHIKNYLSEMKQLKEDNLKTIENINNQESWSEERKRQEIESANNIYDALQRKHWGDVYKYMSESETDQLGSWLGMLANTELYGGKISDENKEMVDFLLEQYDTMPKKTKEAMKNAMSPMLEEMKKSEPGLFAKASGIADGILSRLKKSFDIHSPSKKTRAIFKNVMAGAELGLNDEQNKLMAEVDKIAEKTQAKFKTIMPNMGAIKQSVVDQTRTIYTTPTLNIYAQDELTPAKMNSIIDTVNRRLGSQY